MIAMRRIQAVQDAIRMVNLLHDTPLVTFVWSFLTMSKICQYMCDPHIFERICKGLENTSLASDQRILWPITS